MNKYYLISSNDHLVKEFYANPEAALFTLIPAFDENLLQGISADYFFNREKLTEKLHRKITRQDMVRTLSHIGCWKAIAESNDIQDQEFAIIAEPSVDLVEGFHEAIQDYIQREANYHPFDIILLQRREFEPSSLYKKGDQPITILFHDAHFFNDVGASLYLIRKSRIKSLLSQLQQEKPFWLADYFSEFCDYHDMAQSSSLFGQERPCKDTSLFQPVSQPLFSIIIPVYNVDIYLETCLNTVLAQDYKNYEIILINDGSSDLSRDICEQYGRQYPHITVINKPNSGLSESRNFGIRIAKGNYLVFLDSDDYWQETNILTELSKIIDEANPDLILNSSMSLYPDGSRVNHNIPIDNLSNDFVQDYALLTDKGAYLGFAWTKVVRRKLVEDNRIYFPLYLKFEDIYWSLKLARFVHSYVYYNNPFVVYRRDRPESITSIIANLPTAKDLIKVIYLCMEETRLAKAAHNPIYKDFIPSMEKTIKYAEKYFSCLTERDRDILSKDIEILLKDWQQFKLEQLKDKNNVEPLFVTWDQY